ncbi:MAG TPA: twin-arginine translocase subunit TatC [Gemmatimonadales bacterium]|nr:twin-arginine translocase subunit TatC [Gemmatimonadales bacterium]
MAVPRGEMPFLDHLEELRSRLIKSLVAVIVAFGAGLWIVQRFQFVTVLKQPIAPYLPGGALTILSPTEPVMIVLKLSLLIGLVLASPFLLYQIWAFLSPALYERERRAFIPALVVGTLLFITGAALGYAFVVPQALRVLLSFQPGAFQNMITYDAYFSFVLQILIGLGLSFEIPLVITILAAFGLITPAALNRFRRFEIVLAFAAGALLSPGADVLSMLLMTFPILLLYEVGVAGAIVMHRRRLRRAAAAGLMALVLWGAPLEAQKPTLPSRPAKGMEDSAARALPGGAPSDSAARARVAGGQPVDTAAARRLGLPTAPVFPFPAPDSTMQLLLQRPGYVVTRYRADSVTLFADQKRILMVGEARTEREGATLEAGEIDYQDAMGMLDARGSPMLFSEGNVLVGKEIRYYTNSKRGVVNGALTSFEQGGAEWFLRGSIAQDSSSKRIYAASSEITSCDLPDPHYHFSAGEVKWISGTVMVARPTVLYVRDVPVMWLPFVFQDGRPDRHSGILVPRIGINDVVRTSQKYNRQITNIGYYWAASDYFDMTVRFDWLDNRYSTLAVLGRYRWLDRFTEGSIGFSRQWAEGGGRSTGVIWDHRQVFSLNSSLNLSLNYVTNSSIVRNNAIDPLLTTQQITSALNYTHRYGWGTLTLGGNLRQNIENNSLTSQLPAITLSPKPVNIGSNVTWSPGLSFSTEWQRKQPLSPPTVVTLPSGATDTLANTFNARATTFSLETPLRIGSFNWRNSVRVTDQERDVPSLSGVWVPDTANPGDSVFVTQTYSGTYSTGLDWDTGINLPLLFRGSWKLQPSVGVTNVASGQSYLVRNQTTNGEWVAQSKRFAFNLSASPTFFGFYPGFAGFQRVRHSITPVISYSMAPEAAIPLDFALATRAVGTRTLQLTSPRTERLSIGLNQNIEGKKLAPGADSAADGAGQKQRVLSITTSPVGYDFEQAKEPGRNGWTTQSLTNSFQSDLLPGFNLSITHDLWSGPVGYDSSAFDFSLQQIGLSFAVSSATFAPLLRLFGLAAPGAGSTTAPDQRGYVADTYRPVRPGPEAIYGNNFGPTPLGRAFRANVSYTYQKSRNGGLTQSNIGFNTNFSPTPLWGVSWSTQYNVTDGTFESQIIRLERELHEWRAGFNFVRNPNGNVTLYFSISLTDLPEMKLDYNQ